jgi:F-type H+-transporting ATPase subunit gamma
MAQLTHLRQRIQTVETIKNITHAMRLISMSTQAQLSKKFSAIKLYHAELEKLLTKILSFHPFYLNPEKHKHKLFIIIGSQKGLCGSFNNSIFNILDNYIHYPLQNQHIISVGRKMTDLIKEKYKDNTIMTFDHLSPTAIPAIAQEIAKRIFSHKNLYTEVSVLSNAMKSFFVQKPRIYHIIPIQKSRNLEALSSTDYLWDIEPQTIVDHVMHQYIVSTLHSLLIESLFAEHAARFVSMDNATRNAEKILETTQLKYNKLRQTKITKEIIELADAF